MKTKLKNIQILDCTLRDGSYPVDYQFTAEDTAIIAVGLESAGFQFIEIGHGLGLGASREGHGVAAATDEEYLRAAKNAVKKAKIGMFCIPGIAQLSDVSMAAKHKLDFIRIGTDVTSVDKGEVFVKKAKDLGLFVSYNLMKSYAVSPEEFAKQIRLVHRYGADVVCVVDSAGGMLPDDVRSYVEIVKNETDALVGFHGHDNLCLAIINSLEAVKAGATIVDSSLQGLGRSAGNAQTGILAILLEKMGYRTGVDIYKTLDLGDRVIKSILGTPRGVDAESAILGAEQFHSGFMKAIDKYVKQYSLDSLELISAVSRQDRIKVTDDMVDRIAQRMKPAKKRFRSIHFESEILPHPQGRSLTDCAQAGRSICQEMTTLAKKTKKKTIFTIARTRNREKKQTSFPFVRQNQNYVVGNAEVTNKSDAMKIIRVIDGLVDYFLIDLPLFQELSSELKDLKSLAVSYNDDEAHINSIWKMLNHLSAGKTQQVYITGDGYLSQKLIHQLIYHGYVVINKEAYKKRDFYSPHQQRILSPTNSHIEKADFVIGLTPFDVSIDEKIIRSLSKKTTIIDGGPGSISQKAITYGLKNNLKICRLEMRAGLFGEIESVLKTYYMNTQAVGEGMIGQTRVVSGGIIGKKGDVVLDSIKLPTRIIGIADGKGGLLRDERSKLTDQRINKIKSHIAKSIFS